MGGAKTTPATVEAVEASAHGFDARPPGDQGADQGQEAKADAQGPCVDVGQRVREQEGGQHAADFGHGNGQVGAAERSP